MKPRTYISVCIMTKADILSSGCEAIQFSAFLFKKHIFKIIYHLVPYKSFLIVKVSFLPGSIQ